MIPQLRSTDVSPWSLEATAGPVPEALANLRVPAQVPGTSHTALLDAGLIDDPYVGDAEERLAWMRHVAWRWSAPLTLAPADDDERVDLVLDGVDTVATVRLGDTELARVANMHRSYRLDVRALADGRTRDLVLDVEPAADVAAAEAARLGARPSAYPTPFNMVRKMACSFGWDWGPDLETAGPWRPVRVERWRTARLAQVRPEVAVSDDHARATVAVHVDVERAGLTPARPLRLRARLDGPTGTRAADAVVELAAAESSATLELTVDSPVLWWPVGHGRPDLHTLRLELLDDDPHDGAAGGDRPPLDGWTRRVGLRSVALDTSPDEHGAAFTIVVNGRPVFTRGANWIPDDHLLTRITRERLAARVDQAVAAHLNLLRVWGGGIYETDDFYDVCDERGVMVWQDFPLACAAYPEEEPHRSEFEAEARENVVRLMPHASLVLWNGGNENLWGFMDWGWREQLAGATWGYGYYTELFPAVLAELDPTRPYSAGSPSTPGAAPWELHPNDPDRGTHHQWEVWNRVDYTAYRSEIPRFCSEFGFQAPPAWSTLERAVRPAGGTWRKDDPVWLAHQKAEDGNGKLDRGMAPHLGVPDDFDAWVWAAQLNQARALAYAIDHYRSWWPRTAGAIVWQLNDCWPVTSWSLVDGDGNAKPAWFAVRRAYAPRSVSVHERDGALAVALVNDTDEPWSPRLETARTTLGGRVLASGRAGVTAAPRSVALVPLERGVAVPGDAASELVTVIADDLRVVHPFAEDAEIRFEPFPLAVTVRPAPGGADVEVVATSLARGVTLLTDRVWPGSTVDDGVVDLAAGWRHTFRVRGAGAAPDGLASALFGPGVLRTANELVRAVAPLF